MALTAKFTMLLGCYVELSEYGFQSLDHFYDRLFDRYRVLVIFKGVGSSGLIAFLGTFIAI